MGNYNIEVNERLRRDGNREYQVGDEVVVYSGSAEYEFFEHPDEQTFLLRARSYPSVDSPYDDILAKHREAPDETDEVMAGE